MTIVGRTSALPTPTPRASQPDATGRPSDSQKPQTSVHAGNLPTTRAKRTVRRLFDRSNQLVCRHGGSIRASLPIPPLLRCLQTEPPFATELRWGVSSGKEQCNGPIHTGRHKTSNLHVSPTALRTSATMPSRAAPRRLTNLTGHGLDACAPARRVELPPRLMHQPGRWEKQVTHHRARATNREKKKEEPGSVQLDHKRRWLVPCGKHAPRRGPATRPPPIAPPPTAPWRPVTAPHSPTTAYRYASPVE